MCFIYEKFLEKYCKKFDVILIKIYYKKYYFILVNFQLNSLIIFENSHFCSCNSKRNKLFANEEELEISIDRNDNENYKIRFLCHQVIKR